MQAIRTRYHGPTNTRGSRISAQCAAGRLSVPYAHALDLTDNHRAAADALIAKLDWQRLARDGNTACSMAISTGSRVASAILVARHQKKQEPR